MNLLEKLNEIEYFADSYIEGLDRNKSYNLEEADVYFTTYSGENYYCENLIFDENFRIWRVSNEGTTWEWDHLDLLTKCEIVDHIANNLINV